MLNSTDLHSILADEEYGPLYLAYLLMMNRVTRQARLDAKSRNETTRQEATDFLYAMGLPVEVKRPAKRSHR